VVGSAAGAGGRCRDAILDRLHLPGLAVLLVALKETAATSVFSVPVEHFEAWYGCSERTAERPRPGQRPGVAVAGDAVRSLGDGAERRLRLPAVTSSGAVGSG
jgi:hypothetical protein